MGCGSHTWDEAVGFGSSIHSAWVVVSVRRCVSRLHEEGASGRGYPIHREQEAGRHAKAARHSIRRREGEDHAGVGVRNLGRREVARILVADRSRHTEEVEGHILRHIRLRTHRRIHRHILLRIHRHAAEGHLSNRVGHD